jgi:phosphoribosylaminoimidazolecarboxamide formyltransferase/IMP cyclohydrolase
VSKAINRALISVSNKEGVVEFARKLADAGVAILSTGGTANALREAGIEVTDVSEHTGSPEILDGRVKTLHPKVHGGLLARRDLESHRKQVAENRIDYIDLVCVNLYPFGEVTQRGCDFEEAVENIDIGGPSMIRSAAKNHEHVVVVVDPADYDQIAADIADVGNVGGEKRRELARKAFAATAAYDGMIADYFGWTEDADLGATVHRQYRLVQSLRYGENPHQKAAFYRDPEVEGPSIATGKVMQGKELSFNNIVDADATLQLLLEFHECACVAIKHTNPCGAAIAESPAEAFEKAKACDPVSIFGGIVGFNREVDEATAELMKDVFLEVIIAPSFTQGALDLYGGVSKLRNVRLIQVDMDRTKGKGAVDMKRVLGGVLFQSRDVDADDADVKIVSQRGPTEDEMLAMDFAWRVAKHTRSNAIVLAHKDSLVGVGAGQMSRVDAARIAIARAREHGRDVRGAAVASDAFFPFRDGLDVCAKAGATCVIQPGGSIRDDEITAAADEYGMAMAHTGVRHFKH